MKTWKAALGLGAACAACCAPALLGGAAALGAGSALAAGVAALALCAADFVPLAGAGLAVAAVVAGAVTWTRRGRTAPVAPSSACGCAAGACSYPGNTE